MKKGVRIKKTLVFGLAIILVVLAGGRMVLASYGYGGGGGSIRRGCTDLKALNFATFVTSDPSLCIYAKVFIPKLPNTGLPPN